MARMKRYWDIVALVVATILIMPLVLVAAMFFPHIAWRYIKSAPIEYPIHHTPFNQMHLESIFKEKYPDYLIVEGVGRSADGGVILWFRSKEEATMFTLSTGEDGLRKALAESREIT